MNCMNCKSVVDVGMEICPNCGFNLRVQRKCFSLSNMYYNLGLDKAEIRDLSGAIDMLRRSLKFNKYNIHARNLLGLVYFETGEAVAALSEWIISKNIMPENNVATEYIATLQAEQAKLDMINQTIKKYNSALKCCRENNEDVAAIQLRKILNQNPKLIKGYHLLALIYIHKGEYEKARKILKKAAKIDKTNSTTLRFLKEVDFQTGTQTSLEPRRFGRRERTEEQREDERERVVSGDTVIIPPTFRETSTAATMLNIGIGLVLGALVVWFLIGPANTQRINRQADEKVVEYSGKMASQEAQLNQLQSQVDSLNETTASAQQQIQTAQDTAASYENLLKAVEAQQQGNTSNATNALTEVNPEVLSVDAKAVYDTIYKSMQSSMFQECKGVCVELLDGYIRVRIQGTCTVTVTKLVHGLVCHTCYITDVVGLGGLTCYKTSQVGSLLCAEHQAGNVRKVDGCVIYDRKLDIRVLLCCGSGCICKHVTDADDQVILLICEGLQVRCVVCIGAGL